MENSGKSTNRKKESLSHVPKTSKVAERDFGILDYLIRQKPAATMVALESQIMWINNKPKKWLDSLSAEEKRKVMERARKSYGPTMKIFLERKKKVKEQHIANLKAKQRKKEEKDAKEREDKINLTDRLTALGGLWRAENVSTRLQKISLESKKIDALFTQLQYNKKVLNCKGKPDLFSKTHKGERLTSKHMMMNLMSVLQLNSIVVSVEMAGNILKPAEQYRAEGNIEKKRLQKQIEEQKIKIKEQRDKNLIEKLIANPDLLTNKQIKHCCKDATTKEVAWYDAYVHEILPGVGTEPKNIMYVVEYDNYEFTYDMPLLNDLKNGHLLIVDGI